MQQSAEGLFMCPLENDGMGRSYGTMLREDSNYPGKTRRALADEETFAVALAISPVFAVTVVE
jgi:hypothetical protein